MWYHGMIEESYEYLKNREKNINNIINNPER